MPVSDVIAVSHLRKATSLSAHQNRVVRLSFPMTIHVVCRVVIVVVMMTFFRDCQ